MSQGIQSKEGGYFHSGESDDITIKDELNSDEIKKEIENFERSAEIENLFESQKNESFENEEILEKKMVEIVDLSEDESGVTEESKKEELGETSNLCSEKNIITVESEIKLKKNIEVVDLGDDEPYIKNEVKEENMEAENLKSIIDMISDKSDINCVVKSDSVKTKIEQNVENVDISDDEPNIKYNFNSENKHIPKTETKDLQVVKELVKSSEESIGTDILKNRLLGGIKEETSILLSDSDDVKIIDGDVDESLENNEPVVSHQKFKVNMSAIESVSKENQAAELHNLEGLSVYDQATLEAGILQQVDRALEEEDSTRPTEPTERCDTAVLIEPSDEETEMERKIRLGEMTPFGSTLDSQATPPPKPRDGLSEIEKYLQKQLELQGIRKRKVTKSKKETGEEKLLKTKNFKTKHDPLKRKILNRDSEKKKNKRKREDLGTETEDSVPWSERPAPVAGEKGYIYPDDASGSEYVPTESDDPSSADEKGVKKKEREERPSGSRKRKLRKEAKPYKLPEDWCSDDSDWEYSDEEGNVKKNKRSKKELDDGDVDLFNRRIRQWERERQRTGIGDEEERKYQEFDGGYKLPQEVWEKLYNYQRVGVRWLWELDRQRCGGILGDEMGLGKTIQVIAFLAGLRISDLKDRDTGHRGLGPTLIVCPVTVMHQWVREFHSWYPPLRVAILHESGTFAGKQHHRLISNMVAAGGVLITSYAGATQHKDELLRRNWHYVVLDEGHKIRNPDAQITLVVKQLRTSHRIILSGSPMQNNLKELWSLLDFVFPGKLGTLPVFLEQFAIPITQGGYANASQVQVMTAYKCATVLKDTIAPYLLRRMKADVKSHVKLPEKNEQVLFCRLTDEQRHYYKDYVESGEVGRILEGRLKIFMGLINLRKICNHPDLYSGGPKLFPGQSEEDLAEEEKYGHWSKSGKMIVVETLLKIWKRQEHRVLLFTQSRQMLTIMEAFVRQQGYKYLKLDGGTSVAARQPLINKFNEDTSYFAMLLTTRVGGLGVNLTGADRVLIYDPDWNPATDTQARERAWRIGQQRSVTVYRLITAGTIEEKMYHRQVFKQFLVNKVLKDPRQRRFFKSNDLYELFTLKETDTDGSTETAAIFAGTDSEVKLDPTKKYKHCRVEPKLTAEAPALTFSRKKAEKKKIIEEKIKENINRRDGAESSNATNFSNEKIERMKKLAQMLSQKIVGKSPEKVGLVKDSEQTPTCSSKTNNESIETSPATGAEPGTPGTSNASASRKHKSKHKEKRRKRKDAKFEGEKVPHLVKAGTSKATTSEENEEGRSYATQDEYVLQKLFAKSGLQTAMKHDSIMEGGPADYALVEGEADRVAKEAVEKLKESRRECWRAAAGVPSFTGVNGARRFQPPKKRFGGGRVPVGALSSSEILGQLRKLNGVVDAKDKDLSLVEDIRQFVASNGGTVNTNQLIGRFEGRLEEGSSPLFKSLLSKICTFYRAPDKLGYWTLKEDFNW